MYIFRIVLACFRTRSRGPTDMTGGKSGHPEFPGSLAAGPDVEPFVRQAIFIISHINRLKLNKVSLKPEKLYRCVHFRQTSLDRLSSHLRTMQSLTSPYVVNQTITSSGIRERKNTFQLDNSSGYYCLRSGHCNYGVTLRGCSNINDLYGDRLRNRDKRRLGQTIDRLKRGR